MKNKIIVPWLIVIILLLGLYLFSDIDPKTQNSDTIKLVRASDGTPCYVFKNEFQCDFARANKETNYWEFPYAIVSNEFETFIKGGM